MRSILLWTLLRVLAAPVLVAPALAAPVPAAPEHVLAFVFDWDDNVFEMPTQIMLFHKKTGAQKGVSTEDFALIRESIGHPGTPYADYELRLDPAEGSLRYFGDRSRDGDRRFREDIERAMRSGRTWQGPVWADFVAAASRPSTARNTYFITARLHAPGTIHAALDGLRRKGLIRHTPPADNIWPVADPGFGARFERVFGRPAPGGSAASPSARKAAVMEQILDRVERIPLPSRGIQVLSPDGRSRGAYHLWGFSDDDWGNFEKAVEVLQRGTDAGRWPHVKITVFYTGTNRKDHRPHAIVLTPKAPPRPFREGPAEWKRLMPRSAGRLSAIAR